MTSIIQIVKNVANKEKSWKNRCQQWKITINSCKKLLFGLYFVWSILL